MSNHINGNFFLTELPHLKKVQRQQIAEQLNLHEHDEYLLREAASGVADEWLLLDRLCLNKISVLPDVMRPELMVSRSLAEYLDENRHQFKDKVVFDIGCGSGILGLVMASGVDAASRVYMTDNMEESVKCAHNNVFAHKLSERCHVFECHLFDDIPKDITPDLIVFNHPFFVGDPLSEYRVSATMIAEVTLIKEFLREASKYKCPIIMPYYTKAGEGLEQDYVNDPAVWGIELGYEVVIQRSLRVDSGLQRSYHRIYELAQFDSKSSMEIFRLGRGFLFENTDWGAELNGNRSHLEKQELLVERAFTNLSLRMLVHDVDLVGTLQIYHIEKKRVSTKIVSRWPGKLWDDLNKRYEIDRHTLDSDFDPTLALLSGMENVPNALPFLVKFNQATRPKVEATAQAPSDAFSGCLNVTFGSSKHKLSPPSTVEIRNEAKQLRGIELFSEDSVKAFCGPYMELMCGYFWDNHNCIKKKVDDLNIVLIPLWQGTAKHPILIGSVLAFFQGAPKLYQLRKCVNHSLDYMAPIRLQQETDARTRSWGVAMSAMLAHDQRSLLRNAVINPLQSAIAISFDSPVVAAVRVAIDSVENYADKLRMLLDAYVSFLEEDSQNRSLLDAGVLRREMQNFRGEDLEYIDVECSEKFELKLRQKSLSVILHTLISNTIDALNDFEVEQSARRVILRVFKDEDPEFTRFELVSYGTLFSKDALAIAGSRPYTRTQTKERTGLGLYLVNYFLRQSGALRIGERHFELRNERGDSRAGVISFALPLETKRV